MKTSPIEVDAVFDGGNIVCRDAENPSNIRLQIRPDNQAAYRQWFFFRASNVAHLNCCFFIEDAADTSYPEAWPNSSVFASCDQRTWSLLDTDFCAGVLSFAITPETDICYIALHTPYSLDRHLELISTSLMHASCSLFATGTSVQGRQVQILQVGQKSKSKPVIWIIARQHPAETMAEWFMEGLIKRLLSSDEAWLSVLRDRATLYLIPNMNPDGSVLGNFRTNAAGIDLNRAWDTPLSEASPEVHFVRSCMDATGVDLFLDIHGDEEIHFVFAAGCEGIPGYRSHQSRLDQKFRQAFNLASAEFTPENGYPTDTPAEADLSIACNQIGSRFNCLSLTIEIPFVDNQFNPDTKSGWSSERSMRLGASILSPIYTLLDKLRCRIA